MKTTALLLTSLFCLTGPLFAEPAEHTETTSDQPMGKSRMETTAPTGTEPSVSVVQPGITTNTTADAAKVETIISQWKEKPRKVAEKTIRKYGSPHEVSTNRLIWHRSGPWKFTEVVNEEITHNFPKPHADVLRQGIALDVPVAKFSELAAYDGSVIVERTKGEISARCDQEEMNFLAINLANDIIQGKLTVEDARKQYAQTAAQFMKGERPAYTTGLQFLRPVSDEAGDPDKPMIVESVKGLMD
jgi:hypothetical protein